MWVIIERPYYITTGFLPDIGMFNIGFKKIMAWSFLASF
jgi:hypothetical protein